MSRAAGFALPLTLVLLVVLSLLLAQALGGAAGETALAANQQFRQAALEAAEGGLLAARAAALAAAPAPNGAQVLSRGEDAPPAGYSLDRFVLRHLELRSTGQGPRGATVTLTEGVDQIALQP
jgi:Tfp pilus assembly protein PilX